MKNRFKRLKLTWISFANCATEMCTRALPNLLDKVTGVFAEKTPLGKNMHRVVYDKIGRESQKTAKVQAADGRLYNLYDFTAGSLDKNLREMLDQVKSTGRPHVADRGAGSGIVIMQTWFTPKDIEEMVKGKPQTLQEAQDLCAKLADNHKNTPTPDKHTTPNTRNKGFAPNI